MWLRSPATTCVVTDTNAWDFRFVSKTEQVGLRGYTARASWEYSSSATYSAGVQGVWFGNVMCAALIGTQRLCRISMLLTRHTCKKMST